ncbi:MAG: DUF4282 domain-containing protein [Candidatus Sumerlaeia bacterium]|nr:DUF4282 domain-containing protein [Candidatus Sumerlaeia bacterium]
MEEFLAFRKMITPMIIQVIFWIGVVVAVLLGFVMLFKNILLGLIQIIVGPVLVRIWCELVILAFKMLEVLQEIRENTRPRA